ncbi:unnamed protein product [Euphydryas editha]|uniref:Gustatory receptor n=1 Tax=Euphydryas editha TaxID=104508 RepID=A0AAU9V7N7_EUPED|nr:unnamed protein product [Euphydryas editha]
MSSDTKNPSPEEQPLKETTETLKKESFEQRSFIEKIWLIKSNITVEPVLAEALCPAVTGGWVMIALGVFSYISDITDEESRTFRVGLVNFTFTAGIPIGTIYLITITYGLICLKTKTKPGIEYSQNEKALTFCNIFTLVKETVAVAFKKRDGNLRKKIILLLTMVAIIYGPNHGEKIIAYLFVRYRLKWDALKYSIYSTYSIITHSLGVLFSISVFSKYWGFHDSMLCIISLTSKIVVSVYIAFVRTDLDMYMVPLIEILNATSYTSIRSMISKLVLPEEIGKIYSLFSLVDTLSSLVFEPTYSAMYARTLVIFTGAVYIFHAIMALPPMGISVWFFTQHRRETKLKKREAIEERIVYCETEVNSQ